MKKKIGVILVNYNGKEYNKKCIESILKSTIREQLLIVVVDNASTDDSLEELRECWGESGQVRIIALERNYGFSKANNEGMRWLVKQGIESFLLLNNDTVIEPDTIELMVNSQKKTGAIIVPKVYYADRPEIIWCAGGEFSPVIRKPRQTGLNRPDNARLRVGRYCGFANGCCMLLTKEIVKKVGFLDERFFMYHEDTEYSLRAGEKGIPIWYCADAVVYHKVNGSIKGSDRSANVYYVTRNWLLCSRLHMQGRFLLFLCYFFLNRLAWIVIWTVQRKPKMMKASLAGVRDFFGCRYGKA